MPNDAPISRLKTLDQNDSEKKENLRESNIKKQSGLMGLQLMNLAKDLNVDLGDVESTMLSTVWNRTRAHLKKEGIEIPVFQKSGGVFGV